MKDNIKREINQIKIPNKLSEKGKRGISRAQQADKAYKKTINSKIIGIAASLFVTVTAFFIINHFFFKGPHVIEDIAFVPDIESLAQSSTVIVNGTVLDETEPTNLRSDPNDPNKEAHKITPGTYHTIYINEILAGDIDHKKIKVAVTGGFYKGVQADPQVDLKADHDYIFFLNISSEGHPYYFGSSEPYIFEINNDQVKAISNLDYQTVFEDDHISVDALYEKIDKAFHN